MKKIQEGVWTWSAFSEEKQLDFNGLYLHLPGGCVVIDPPQYSEEVVRTIKSLGKPEAIVLTNKDHVRHSEELRQQFQIPILIHELDRPYVTLEVDKTFKDKELLFGALEVVHLPYLKSPGESAFYWKEREILIVGDALIGKPAGALSLLPPAKYENISKAFESVKRNLSPYSFEMLLVGDGTSLTNHAKVVFARFVQDFRL